MQVSAMCFFLSREGNPKREKTQSCFMPHYPLPPHAANFLPYHCAQQPEAARTQQKAGLPCSKALTALVWQFLQAAPGTAPLVLTFGFLPFFSPSQHCSMSFWNKQALLSKSGTHADTHRASRGSLMSLIKYARTHFKNMNPHTDKQKIY